MPTLRRYCSAGGAMRSRPFSRIMTGYLRRMHNEQKGVAMSDEKKTTQRNYVRRGAIREEIAQYPDLRILTIGEWLEEIRR